MVPESLWMVTAATNSKMLAPWKESYEKPDSVLESRESLCSDQQHMLTRETSKNT